jgi:hypothetical protein
MEVAHVWGNGRSQRLTFFINTLFRLALLLSGATSRSLNHFDSFNIVLRQSLVISRCDQAITMDIFCLFSEGRQLSGRLRVERALLVAFWLSEQCGSRDHGSYHDLTQV